MEWGAGGDSGEKWRDNIHPLSARNPCGEYILCQLNKVELAVLILLLFAAPRRRRPRFGLP